MKPTGKILQAEFDQSFTVPDANDECCYCLTNGQVRALLAMTEYLGWPARWYSDTDAEIDQQKITDFRDDLIRRLFMSCGESKTILKRVNPTTGYLEQSIDGGVSWEPSPEDPRIGYPQPIPPVTSGIVGDKCDAAANVVSFTRDTIVKTLEAKSSTQNLATFLLVVAAIIMALFVPGSWFWIPVLLEPIVNLLFGLDAAQIITAMSSLTYDEFQCVLYCNIQDDGSFTDANYEEILADIPAGVTDATAQRILIGLVKGWKAKGLNLAANYGMREGTECDCECGCGDWSVATRFNSGTGSPIGVIIEQTDTYIIVESRFDGVDSEAFFLTTGDKDICCALPLAEVELISGPAWTTTGSVACGDELTVWGFSGWNTVCNSVSLAKAYGGDPDTGHFRVKIYKHA